MCTQVVEDIFKNGWQIVWAISGCPHYFYSLPDILTYIIVFGVESAKGFTTLVLLKFLSSSRWEKNTTLLNLVVIYLCIHICIQCAFSTPIKNHKFLFSQCLYKMYKKSQIFENKGCFSLYMYCKWFAYANKTMFVCDAPCNMLTTSFCIHDTQNKCKPFGIINCQTSQNFSDMFIRLTYITKGENICEKDLLYGNTHFLL
jgi:hypothetical protein